MLPAIVWFPLATLTCDQSQPAPPHTALVERRRTASRTGQWPRLGRLRAEGYQAEKSPRGVDQEALPKPPGTAEHQEETGVLRGPPRWLGGGSLRPAGSVRDSPCGCGSGQKYKHCCFL